jgi:hypothetical protein
MEKGLTFEVVYPDSDYLGIEIHAANERFAGSTRIYAGLKELSDFAKHITGFPVDPHDVRQYEFGSRARSFAGGYCRLHFRCKDQLGHAEVGVDLEDDSGKFQQGIAKFSLRFEAAGMDRFVKGLIEIEQERSGKANLPLAR